MTIEFINKIAKQTPDFVQSVIVPGGLRSITTQQGWKPKPKPKPENPVLKKIFQTQTETHTYLLSQIFEILNLNRFFLKRQNRN